ncbi:MAG: FAD-dependent 5-carboxymethylaminomethyl-2-thiouridine(34) oxidoreductase MnmC, partial [Psittacicella sp.]
MDISFNKNTLYSEYFHDYYYSTDDPINESYYNFINGNNLFQRWISHKKDSFIICESGFGTGLNFFLTAYIFEIFLKTYPQKPLKKLFFISFEINPLKKEIFNLVHKNKFYSNYVETFLKLYATPINSLYRYKFQNITLDIFYGDILDNIDLLGDHMNSQVDSWYLDGFNPKNNKGMWSHEFFKYMRKYSKVNSTLASFTAASFVQKNLSKAGFIIKKRSGFGKKRNSITGYCDPYFKFENNIKISKESINAPWNRIYKSTLTLNKHLDIGVIGGGIGSFFVIKNLLEKGYLVDLYIKEAQLGNNTSSNEAGIIYPQLSDDDDNIIRFYNSAYSFAKNEYLTLKDKFEFNLNLNKVLLNSFNEVSTKRNKKITNSIYNKDLAFKINGKEASLATSVPIENDNNILVDGGFLSPSKFITNGFNYLISKGLRVHFSTEISSIQKKEDKWILKSKNMSFKHSNIILACGADLIDLDLGNKFPLTKERGQVDVVSLKEFKNLKIPLCYKGYIIPMSNKYQLIGASHIKNFTNNSYSKNESDLNLLNLNDSFKELDISQFNPIRSKVGIRLISRDRMPFVGNMVNYNEIKSVYYNLFNKLRRSKNIEEAPIIENLFIIGALGSRGYTTS